jgi:hypothetical protein
MYITYKLMGFEETGPDESPGENGMIELEYRGSGEKEYPSYLKFILKSS